MEDMYIKPGNQERGWNDPPQFSYSLQMARGPQRNLLNKRAAPPAALGTVSPPPPSTSPRAPPPSGVAPPPLHPARPPPGCVAMPPPPLGPIRSQREADSRQSESKPEVDGVMWALNRALAACRQTVKDQVCSDMAKRLRLLEDSWRAGRLSLSVRRRMDTLTLELQSGHWDSADEIHRSLMVDHVTEVSQWIVGVKRLIAETRKLNPELLKPLQKPPVKPLQNPAGSVQDPTGAGSVQDPEQLSDPAPAGAGSVQDPAGAGSVQDPAGAGSVQDPAGAGAVQDPTGAVQDPEQLSDPAPAGAGSVQDPTGAGSVQDPAGAGSVQDPAGAGSVQDPAGAGSVQDPAGAGSVQDC
ncbi:steroid receptor RNA activator 1 [Cottoperca gobio]|uniref:Steroid receptor RNA activator 1 n=1 Tax=Cottoperca gobio TaxID=56716 RepID=A0A6J2QYV0_COTGO|nr:steroid receptor RNA activator 1 [Cottoperca gobio]